MGFMLKNEGGVHARFDKRTVPSTFRPMKQPKHILVFVFTTLFLLVLHCTAAPKEPPRTFTGFKCIKNFSPEVYKLLAQNWCILQTPQGIIYTANQGGILEFDGVSWNRHTIANVTVRSMDMAPDGTIYIGGLKEIGFLRPDETGSLIYVSLMPKLDEKNQDFSEVYQVHCTGRGTWFRTAYKLLLWQDNHFTVKTPEHDKSSFKAMFTWNGKCFVQEGEIGLRLVVGDSFRDVPAGQTFKTEKIAMAASYGSQKLLIGTSFAGFYLYDGSTAERFPTEVDDYLKTYRLYHGIRLADNTFALATIGGGVVVMDASGRLKEIFNIASGLQDDNVKYVFEDSCGILWLGLNKGISRIDLASPISFFDQRCNLNEVVTSISRYNGRLYVGTSNGLFYLEPNAPGTVPIFRHVAGISANCWDLLTVGDSLLAATSSGVFSVDEKNPGFARLEGPSDESFVLAASRKYPGRVWVGTASKLLALHGENNRWITRYRIDNNQQDIQSLLEDDNGNLWLGSRTQGLLKFDFTTGEASPRITLYNTDHGLPKGEIYVARAAGHVTFATSDGLYRFNEDTRTFAPDLVLGTDFAGGREPVFRLVEDPAKHIWFHSGRKNFHAAPGTDGTFTVDDTPFLRIPQTQVHSIYPDGQTVWFGCTNGLIRYDTTVPKDYRLPFSALIRYVTIKGRTLVYGGFRTLPQILPASPVLNYTERNLYFEVAAAYFEEESKTRYQYFMEGSDDDWSDWTSASFKQYTNIDAGKHKFRVRARNVYGTISREDVFSFQVLPPWFRTWWAFALYAAAAFLLIHLIVRWRSAKLVMEKQRLEGVIKERTRLINEANAQLKQKTLLLEEQSEKLQEMDKVKSRFFANISHEFRTPLTLIMGPLDQIRADCADSAARKRIDLAHRNAQRLLGLINQLLDLSKFESGKMKLQAEEADLVPFLKGILEPFEVAAANSKLKIHFHSFRGTIPLFFDPEKLEKIVGNLLSNAVKFTPPGGCIDVSVTGSETFVDIAVRDTGRGIPAGELEHIFDRFFQADTTAEHHHKGSGIGLALVKELVELHHGVITVQSKEGDGSGTEFVLRLPQGRAHLSSGEIVERSSRQTGQTEAPLIPLLETVPLSEEETADISAEADDSELSAGKESPQNIILVVEDNADLRFYIRSSLEPDYSVIEAKNGREGIEKAGNVIPDLIISDIMMPEVDGYELCRAVKSDVSTSHIPVILLTARASEESIVQGLETGADDYVTKPFNTRVLRARIANLIELRRQLQLNLNREMFFQPSMVKVSNIDREFLGDLESVLEKNLSDPDFNVEELSRRLYMSRTTVYRKIQALSGESPTDFIRYYRLKRAAQLLKSNFGSITEVAFEVGFNSRAYFTKCFKEKFHQLPSEYITSQ
jgi:signal transduction histidine kinase/DNA-binding response OmpR family regulator